MLDMAGSCVTQEHQILCLASVGQLFQLAVRNLKYDTDINYMEKVLLSSDLLEEKQN